METVFCSTCLAACVLVLFVNAITRACGYSIRFSNDLALAFFSYITFVGVDIAYRNDKLARIDILSKYLPGKAKIVLECIVLILSLALFVLLAFLGIQLVERSWIRPIASLPQVSYGWIIVGVPIGAILMSITTLLKLHKLFQHAPSGAEKGE